MNYLPVYLLYTLCMNFVIFLKHWYYDAFCWFRSEVISLLESLDQIFALSLTSRYLFKPLYQDYSIPGYILSIPARFSLFISGLLVYAFIIIASLLLFLTWASLPIIFIIKSITAAL